MLNYKSVYSLLKKKIGSLYDRYNEVCSLDMLIGFFERNNYELVSCDVSVNRRGGNIKGQYLVATNSHGIVLICDKKCKSIISAKGSYGITTANGFYYAFLQTGRHGSIIRFSLKDTVSTAETVVYGLSRGIHQIDIVDDKLYVTDTYNNRLIVFESISNIVNEFWKKSSRCYYPNGKLNQGRKSLNYNHFNSVLVQESDVLLMAHNETLKTGRLSEIFVLNRNDIVVRDVIKTEGSNCHNIVGFDGGLVYCKSIEGEVSEPNATIDLGYFTRGLSISEDEVLVGGSAVQKDRSKRGSVPSVLISYDRENKCERVEIELPNCQIHEIRRVDKVDFGLSERTKLC